MSGLGADGAQPAREAPSIRKERLELDELLERVDRRGRASLDTPASRPGRRLRLRPQSDPETFGRLAERFARFMGTARFLVYMTAFVAVWLLWNTLAPEAAQFDPRRLNYTLLTLILSLQASYAAPLILLAQNRQDDRDRVQNAQDRSTSERALADTEYLTREVAALKVALRDVATRDFLRSELRDLLEELEERESGREAERKAQRKADRKGRKGGDRQDASDGADRVGDLGGPGAEET
ncbi:DUF1003 domain-containing protein [Aquipuribacter sp. SD81]|uniref:DUF1003 domain-containing protein n=1 Tax=Aquipuribacter sp. SD81 TaxID=3127703 RepID=UPI003016EF48